MYLENQESVREKSGKSQGFFFVKVCGNPVLGARNYDVSEKMNHYSANRINC